MDNTTKIVLAVVGGYVLGRRKKARFALLLGSALVGKRLDLRSLGQEAFERLSESPQFGRIKDEVTGELVSTGRAAAMATLTKPLDRLADSLEERTSGLTGKPSADGKGRRREDEDRAEGEEPEEPEKAEEAEEPEEPEEERAESRRGERKGRPTRGRGGEGRSGHRPTGEGRRPGGSRGRSERPERGGRGGDKGERARSERSGGRGASRGGSR